MAERQPSEQWRASDHPEAVRRRTLWDHYEESKRVGRPGPGARRDDCGTSGFVKIHLKSIPNVPTARLQRRLTVLHDRIHTRNGLHGFEGTRRQLIETGLAIRCIVGELLRRDAITGCPQRVIACRPCTNTAGQTSIDAVAVADLMQHTAVIHVNVKPMAVATRPQDWAPAARRHLFGA